MPMPDHMFWLYVVAWFWLIRLSEFWHQLQYRRWQASHLPSPFVRWIRIRTLPICIETGKAKEGDERMSCKSAFVLFSIAQCNIPLHVSSMCAKLKILPQQPLSQDVISQRTVLRLRLKSCAKQACKRKQQQSWFCAQGSVVIRADDGYDAGGHMGNQNNLTYEPNQKATTATQACMCHCCVVFIRLPDPWCFFFKAKKEEVRTKVPKHCKREIVVGLLTTVHAAQNYKNIRSGTGSEQTSKLIIFFYFKQSCQSIFISTYM